MEVWLTNKTCVYLDRALWELDHKEGWMPKNWCFRIVVLEKTLESPLDYKEIKPVNHKRNQLWILIGKTDAEAPTLWPPDAKSQLIGKDPDAGRDWGQEEKGVTEDEMLGCHHWLNGLSLSKFWETVKDREAWSAAAIGSQRVRHDLANEQQHYVVIFFIVYQSITNLQCCGTFIS